MTALRRLCFPEGAFPAGRRFRAACHCGYLTTPRARAELAAAALPTEHGWTGAVHGCGICGWTAEDVRIGDIITGHRITSAPPDPWQAYQPLADPDRGREVWVCLDQAACSDRYQQHRVLGMTRAELDLLGLDNVYPLRSRR
ncbi:MAG: hypothetical protein ABIP57_09635 [Jatrophihabitantaceae bacterium]